VCWTCRYTCHCQVRLIRFTQESRQSSPFMDHSWGRRENTSAEYWVGNDYVTIRRSANTLLIHPNPSSLIPPRAAMARTRSASRTRPASAPAGWLCNRPPRRDATVPLCMTGLALHLEFLQEPGQRYAACRLALRHVHQMAAQGLLQGARQRAVATDLNRCTSETAPWPQRLATGSALYTDGPSAHRRDGIAGLPRCPGMGRCSGLVC
jgi:hypothetical protein